MSRTISFHSIANASQIRRCGIRREGGAYVVCLFVSGRKVYQRTVADHSEAWELATELRGQS
jgi:hypothetical protein